MQLNTGVYDLHPDQRMRDRVSCQAVFSQKESQLLYALYRFWVTSVMVTNLSIHPIIMVTWDHSIFNKQLIPCRNETVCGLTKNSTWTFSKILDVSSWHEMIRYSWVTSSRPRWRLYTELFLQSGKDICSFVPPSLCSSASSIFITSSSCD